jgi:hypothetical protein
LSLDVDSTTVASRWFRHVPADADPVRRLEPPADNRWQRGDVIDALYLVDDELCVWAEWYRHLAEAAIPPHAALPGTCGPTTSLRSRLPIFPIAIGLLESVSRRRGQDVEAGHHFKRWGSDSTVRGGVDLWRRVQRVRRM